MKKDTNYFQMKSRLERSISRSIQCFSRIYIHSMRQRNILKKRVEIISDNWIAVKVKYREWIPRI
jgi:uncharacterized membrane protein